MFELIGNYFHFITNPSFSFEFIGTICIHLFVSFCFAGVVVSLMDALDEVGGKVSNIQEWNILHYFGNLVLVLSLLIMLFFFIGPFLYFAVFVGIPVLIVVGIGYGLTKIKPYYIVQFFKQFKIKIEKK